MSDENENLIQRLREVERYIDLNEGKIEERWENQFRFNKRIEDFVEEVRTRLIHIERRMWMASGAAGVVAAVASSILAFVLGK